MLYFFKNKFMEISWHDAVPDKNFLNDMYKKLKNAEYIEIVGQIESIDFSRTYFQDGSYRHDIEINLQLTLGELSKLVGNTGGEGRTFANLIITSDVYHNIVLSDFFITSTSVEANAPIAHVKAKAHNYVKLKSTYANFINNYLKNKKIDTSMYPYDNDKDFFLL